MNVNLMRSEISKVYPGKSWKEKVQKMGDDQVIAVYYEFKNSGRFDVNKPKPVQATPVTPAIQITVDDILNAVQTPPTYTFPNKHITIRIPHMDTMIGEYTVCPSEVMLKAWQDKIGQDIDFDGMKRTVNAVRVVADFIFIDMSETQNNPTV